MLTFGSLFTGIGGMDLGLERAGWKCKWQVEINGYCQRVLRKHWPDVPKYTDITKVEKLPYVDLIAGGFPCQDVSNAGKREGIGAARSGLWSEFNRIICLVRPQFVLVENVPGLLVRGMGTVLGDLAESGYDAEWDCISAESIGAPHVRYRVFIIAFNRDANCQRFKNYTKSSFSEGSNQDTCGDGKISNPTCFHAQGFSQRSGEGQPWRSSWWKIEPDVGRVADGVSARVDRLTGLGNAVVPQVAEWIGRRIIDNC